MVKKKNWSHSMSIKGDSTLKSKNRPFTKTSNIGFLMRKFPALEEELYLMTQNSELIYEDMDLTIDEFSEISGIDLEELFDVIEKVMKTR